MTILPGVWPDVVYSPLHGFVVVASGPAGTVAWRLRDGVELWRQPCYYLMVRAVVVPDGGVAAIGQDSRTDEAIVCAPSPQGLGWRVATQNGCLLTVSDGVLVAYVQTSGTTYVRQVIGGPRASEQPVPIGPTSQGWLDYCDGELIWTDPNRVVDVDGLRLVCAMSRGGCWVGQPADRNRGTVGTYQGRAFLAIPDAVGGPNPHVATDGAGQFAIVAPLDGELVAVAICPPFPALPSVTPAPVPAPTPTPVPPPAPAGLRPPLVGVDRWTLDTLTDGAEFVGHDIQNPQLDTRCRVWVERGSMYMEISYPGLGPAFVGRTGKFRAVQR